MCTAERGWHDGRKKLVAAARRGKERERLRLARAGDKREGAGPPGN